MSRPKAQDVASSYLVHVPNTRWGESGVESTRLKAHRTSSGSATDTLLQHPEQITAKFGPLRDRKSIEFGQDSRPLCFVPSGKGNCRDVFLDHSKEQVSPAIFMPCRCQWQQRCRHDTPARHNRELRRSHRRGG
jgi:hypothetical protein